MATSGTIATTTINTATLIEHSLLRARVPLSSQSPEIIQKAQENLYFLLLGMSNNGLNLWCVDKGFIGLNDGQATYSLPKGTLDVLNVVHSQPTIASSSFSAITNGGKVQSSNSPSIVRIGWQFNAAYTGTLAVSHSDDDITYTQVLSIASDTYSAGQWYYADLPASINGSFVTLTGTAAPVSAISLIVTSYDMPVSQWNRDTWAVMNNKDRKSHPATNYFFEKKIVSQITLWPVPDSSLNYIMFFRHRQIQDVGSLTQELEIPARWMEGIIWQLTLRVVFEMPEADTNLIQLISTMADKHEFEAELGETDGSTISINPGIRGYSR